MFGSGANHGIYAQVMTQASVMNNGKWIGLLRGAGAWFATWFYALYICFIKRMIFWQLILAHNAKTALAVQDIESNQFWKAVYFLLRAMFPALRALTLCDANKPAMNEIFYFCDRDKNAFLRSSIILIDNSLFVFLLEEFKEGVDEELEEVIGCTKDDLIENEELI